MKDVLAQPWQSRLEVNFVHSADQVILECQHILGKKLRKRETNISAVQGLGYLKE